MAVGLGNVLSIRYTYDRALWSEIAIQGVAGHLRNVLQALVEDANRPVSELPLLDEQQQRLVVEQWNRCQPTATDGLSVSALIEAQVARTPQAQAVRFADESLTYQGLNDRANQLAHELRALGVGPDVLVGIAMERSLDLVVGLLAILKAGGAYVPMDPEYPRERLTSHA